MFGEYTEKYEVIIFNIAVMILLGFWSKVSVKIMRKFIFIALLFALSSSIPLLFERRYERIMLMLLRAINGAIAISVFALTTPINHVVYLMSKNKCLQMWHRRQVHFAK